MDYADVVKKLKNYIDTEPGWKDRFDKAIDSAKAADIKDWDIDSIGDYYTFIDGFLKWAPQENTQGDEVMNRLCKFHFLLDQPTVRELQRPIRPRDGARPESKLSDWMVDYAKEMGGFLDTEKSLTPDTLKSFKNSPNYNLSEYDESGGAWTTFNRFFARHVKPGARPIAAPSDESVVVSPADSTFGGQWEIRADSKITLKGLHWTVEELLADSDYASRFMGGTFMHAFLSPLDYHRLHAPVGGKVLEAKVIPGDVYLEVTVQKSFDREMGGQQRRLSAIRVMEAPDEHFMDAPDSPGYQFAQARGLVVLETAIGLVAVLPIGMAQVSSVNLSVAPNDTVEKGAEIAYFQFGGSDIVVLFAESDVDITAKEHTHYKMGTAIAKGYL
ncbi:phosphatidylserine decarboxylase [Actinomadura litoris]|uniref:phosphatidylserine decarboxylase n=1 Tax=Actinomadura litoris TaxID=2678616 RepID=UPI001FA74D28|nr:phosphatidylserine decarboxylase [Actinomadura litoris]